jgi:hypothetical protein
MARDDEFPPPPPPPTPADGHRRLNGLRLSCDKKGAPVEAYYKPVVAFAREHLLDKEHDEVHESLVMSDALKPRLSDGVNIVVEPRESVGELRVAQVGPPFYAPGKLWTERGYCLHVLRQSGTTTIAIEQAWEMIR